ncbi:MAG: BON domain-containing protein [Xanthomonadales bacterium]|nr:BON domain-containing protein [Xanthomonadales bacterium]
MRPLSALALLLAAALAAGCAPLLIGAATVTALAVHDRRPAATVIDDQRIESAAYRRFARDPELSRAERRLGVVAHNGIVLLYGEVGVAAHAARAEQLAAGIDGVRQVVNAIETGPPADGWRLARDAALTARVKAALLDITSLPGFDPTRVNVTSSRGVVYLMGLLRREEAEAVVEVARHVRGVRRVVTVFEYLEGG